MYQKKENVQMLRKVEEKASEESLNTKNSIMLLKERLDDIESSLASVKAKNELLHEKHIDTAAAIKAMAAANSPDDGFALAIKAANAINPLPIKPIVTTKPPEKSIIKTKPTGIEKYKTCLPSETICYTDLPHSLRTPPDKKYLDRTKNILKESFCGRLTGGKPFPPSLCKEALPEVKPICKDHALATSYCSTLQKGRVVRLSQNENTEAKRICTAKGYAPCKGYSQQYEDLVIFGEYFKDSIGSSFTYLELGALDGVAYANTLFFEETLGWKGVLIEASKPSFSSLKRNRSPSNNAMYNLAVCKENGMITLLGTNAEAGISDTMSTFHFNRNKAGAKSQIRCQTMKSILNNANVAFIDFWSLDVEGAEYDVLLGMDWTIPVHVLIHERTPRDRDIEKFLLEKGFRYSREQRGNRIWVDDNYHDKKKALSGNNVLKTGIREVDQYGSINV